MTRSILLVLGAFAFGACLPTAPMDHDGHAETYGQDDRTEVWRTSNPDPVRWSRSAVTFIPWDLIQRLSPTLSQIRTQGMSLRQRAGVCSTERFSGQPSVGYCSGFLAGPDLVVTAGHCFRDNSKTETVEELCRTHAIVFGFAYEVVGGDISLIPEENLYRCAPATVDPLNPIVHDVRWRKDYGVIRLDRPVPPRSVSPEGVVTGRDPLPLRRDSRVELGAFLTLIGSPHGLPIKIDEGVDVTQAEPSLAYFVSTADTYELNSGSMVLDELGRVVGMHVGGGPDYVRSPNNCWTTRICSAPGVDGACMGSRELHASVFAQDVPLLPSELAPAVVEETPPPSDPSLPAEPLPE